MRRVSTKAALLTSLFACLAQDDFGVGDLVPKADGKDGASAKKKKKGTDTVVEAVTSELDSIRLGRDAEMVSVAKDVSRLSEAEKLGVYMRAAVVSALSV